LNSHDLKTGTIVPASDSDATNDLLSDVLRFVQLKGDQVFELELQDGFDVLFEAGASSFHVVHSGKIVVSVAGAASFLAQAGDVLVFPHSAAYQLSEHRTDRRFPSPPVSSGGFPNATSAKVVHGAGNVAATTTSATFLFENREGVSSLLNFLPPVIHIPASDEAAGVIRQVSNFLLIETASPEPGATLMISRVIDILVIRSIRTWAKTMDAQRGWVGALADARISRVVAAMHRDPAKDWGLSELASLAGMSRSSLAERFIATVGEPALRYLQRWRMAMAADLLRNTNSQVQDVAHSIGYESEAAFSRAYKAMYGISPRDARSRSELFRNG